MPCLGEERKRFFTRMAIWPSLKKNLNRLGWAGLGWAGEQENGKLEGVWREGGREGKRKGGRERF
jgi:hypothetical protein